MRWSTEIFSQWFDLNTKNKIIKNTSSLSNWMFPPSWGNSFPLKYLKHWSPGLSFLQHLSNCSASCFLLSFMTAFGFPNYCILSFSGAQIIKLASGSPFSRQDRKIKKAHCALFCDTATSPFLSVFGNKLLADRQFLLSAPRNPWQHVTCSSRFLYSGHSSESRKNSSLISSSH